MSSLRGNPTEDPRTNVSLGTKSGASSPFLKRLLAVREMPTVLALLILAVGIAVRNPTFLSSYNMQLLAKEIGVLGIMAIAEMLVIITRGIDLSVGSLVALVSVGAAMGIEQGLSAGLVVLGTMAACGAIGLLHAFFISRVGMPPFIITLASLSVWRGVVLVITQGYPVRVTNPTILHLGQGDLMGIPTQFIILTVIAGTYIVILLYTPLGRHIFALGNNPVATQLSGVRTARVLTFVYVQASMLFGIAGLVYAARLGQGMPGIGKGLELPVIASAVIGGTAMAGGSGTIWGTILGATLISLILNALNMLAVSHFWHELVTGLVIVLAVVFDILNRRRIGVLA